jgi:8-oxo-dGTP diphosphatase
VIIYKQKARQQYTVLFAFNSDKSKIALIKKNRPDWQKGFYNGIGGKVEENETFLQAATREFFEEAGIVIE